MQSQVFDLHDQISRIGQVYSLGLIDHLDLELLGGLQTRVVKLLEGGVEHHGLEKEPESVGEIKRFLAGAHEETEEFAGLVGLALEVEGTKLGDEKFEIRSEI